MYSTINHHHYLLIETPLCLSRNRTKFLSPICQLLEEQDPGGNFVPSAADPQHVVAASTKARRSTAIAEYHEAHGLNYSSAALGEGPSKGMASATTTPHKSGIGNSSGGSNNQYFSLRWNNYQSNLTSVFHELLETQSFVDVTLACEDSFLKAHKVRVGIAKRIRDFQHPPYYFRWCSQRAQNTSKRFCWRILVTIRPSSCPAESSLQTFNSSSSLCTAERST